MLRSQCSRAAFSEVPFMYDKETLFGFQSLVICSDVFSLLLYLFSTLLIKCTG